MADLAGSTIPVRRGGLLVASEIIATLVGIVGDLAAASLDPGEVLQLPSLDTIAEYHQELRELALVGLSPEQQLQLLACVSPDGAEVAP